MTMNTCPAVTPLGGMVSLLWHAARGPVLAGSMDPYRQNEPNNMQMPRWQFDICTTSRSSCAAMVKSIAAATI